MRLLKKYDNYIVTSPFGMRVHPVTKKTSMHNGIDIVGTSDGKTGQTDYITAHTGGTVESVGYNEISGNYVRIRVDEHTIMSYCHFTKKPAFKTGDVVKAGQTLGYMGSTGRATGAHLHWGIKVNGTWIDPAPYLDADYKTPVKTVAVDMEVLRRGAKGECVKTLQRLLLALGYDMEGYGVDGSFGGATERAVKAYQKKSGLEVDGVVGKATWTSLLK